jgi:hypothetical protein
MSTLKKTAKPEAADRESLADMYPEGRKSMKRYSARRSGGSGSLRAGNGSTVRKNIRPKWKPMREPAKACDLRMK